MALNNSQHNFIMKIYSDRRSLAERALSERNKEIAEKLPEYTALCEETASLAIAATKARISGDDAEEQRCLNKMNAISFDKTDLLLKNGYPQNYLELWYECPDCKDTGYLPSNAKCHCLNQQIIELLYEQSNLKEFVKENNFDNLSYDYYEEGESLESFKRAVIKSRELIENIDLDSRNILFYGFPGTGKSFLSGCIAKEVLDTGHSVAYFSSVTLFDALARETFENKTKENLYNLYEYIYNCDLLIVDDLGTEVANHFVSSQLFSFINERNLRKKSTIISTNLSLEQIKDRYSERVFSRIISTYTVCKLSGTDIRIIKRNSK